MISNHSTDAVSSSSTAVTTATVVTAAAGLAAHILLRITIAPTEAVLGIPWPDIPLVIVLAIAGTTQVVDLTKQILRGELGADVLAGISIVSSVLLGEYLAGALVVLMLSGGQALEAYSVRRASSVLEALARRMPTTAHRKEAGSLVDQPVHEIDVGDELVVFPHETAPVDGTVVDGSSTMDESYLTGEPFVISKAPGSAVLSGAINGNSALTIRAVKRAVDSRYEGIMRVMRQSAQQRPELRRLGDQLGAIYTPLAVTIAVTVWIVTGDPLRFLAVLVIATPCPLLIAIPVAVIGSISLAARRGIIIKDPAILERLATCRTAMFDKTGTLTYGKPKLTEIVVEPGFSEGSVLAFAASVERYSRHPLAAAVLEAARQSRLTPSEAAEVSELPGEGLAGLVDGRRIRITSRKLLARQFPEIALPSRISEGLECVVLVDNRFAATLRFRDEPRTEGRPFIQHLTGRHGFERLILVSGDRESEVAYLAREVGIQHVYASQSPEQKLALVRAETERANTVYLGDGINDAPALTAATVGIAFGKGSDVTAEAAGAVVLDNSLQRVDELLHIGRRMRSIALQSAIGGMALSVIGMLLAAVGILTPVAGAIAQELIDVAAVANALRVAIVPQTLSDY